MSEGNRQSAVWDGGPIRIATRKSALALWQAEFVRSRLVALGHQVELVPVVTQGDVDSRPFSRIEGQGFFTKAVQDAVLDGRADLAVHSHKDLPSQEAPGLEVAAVPERADPRDVLLVNRSAFSGNDRPLPLEPGARVGTSAARRRKQLAALRPDLELVELRGNVPTRVAKLRNGEYDAIVLAAAGLSRLQLELSGLETLVLAPEVLVPAPAQGALALEIRRSDYRLASVLTDLHSVADYRAISAERGLMAMLQGGCQLALGAHAELVGENVKLRGWYEGSSVLVEHSSPEGAAMLAFDALGRPDGLAARSELRTQ
ncbi:MAG: hydroxymethylbilane synthase [Trueperaceae bacterium]